jgi:thioesterase domain-containing protein
MEVKPEGSRLPLFVISGGISLAAYLDPDQPVYGLSFLGLFKTQITHINLKEIAASYVQSIRTLQPTGPYYLAGYSSDGIVAFEMAQLLVSKGEKIGLLALLDTYGPRSKSLSFFRRLPRHWKALKQREPNERLAYIGEKISLIVGQARRVFWRILYQSFLLDRPILVTSKNLSTVYDYALRNHMPQKYPGRAVLLRSKEGTIGDCDDSERGWTGMLAGGLEIHEVPGDHMTMLNEPQVRKVAERLTECLHKAQLEDALPNEFGCQAHESYARAELAEIKKDTSA